MTTSYLVGDVFARMAEIPDGSVSLIASSPPFVKLRSYLPDDHPDKALEIGSEPDPATFIATLLALTAEWGRLLAPWGSIAIELGDTYASPGGVTDNRGSSLGGNDMVDRRRGGGTGWPRDKSLALIPQAYALSLAYGRNVLTGEPSPAGQWLVRNVIVWHRPNPAVGALGDKVRPSTSYITVATRSAKRWYDLTAVRQPLADSPGNKYVRKVSAGDLDGRDNATKGIDRETNKITKAYDPMMSAGAPPLDVWFDEHDVWTITSSPTKLAHYACVDDQTQALSRHGWKSHHELCDGDQIAAFDQDTQMITWQPATFHRYDYAGDMVAINQRETSQRLTPNHRVLVSDRYGKQKVVLAHDLQSSHRLPLAAPFNDDCKETVGPSLAELLGWYISEGGCSAGRTHIYQSETVNPTNCDIIRALLSSLGAEYSETSRLRRGSLSPHPEWTECRWEMRGEIRQWLISVAPDKKLTADVVLGWSHTEIAALLAGLVGGDGHVRRSGRRSFIQQDQATMDMAQALVCRLGMRSTIGQSTDALALTIGSRTRASLRGTNGVHRPVPREHYEGVVWCPSVPSTFWLARRNGRPFITGNTWPPKLAERLILMMCPREVCSVCDTPRRRIEGAAAYINEAGRAANMDMDRSKWRKPDELVKHFETTGSNSAYRVAPTLGWSSCGHGAFVPGRVLDPFAGTGTTLCVADIHGRDAIGIDIDSRNEALMPARYDECKRVLFGTAPEIPGQLDMFG